MPDNSTGTNMNIIFDMDGVIFDTERFWLNCCIPAAKELGMRNFAEVYPRCIGLTEPETWRVMMDAYGDRPLLEEMYAKAGAIFHKRYEEEGLPVKPGAREILVWLKEQQIPTALASSTKEEIVTKELTDAGLLQYFDTITCGDHVERSKPAPDIFIEAARRLGEVRRIGGTDIAPQDCFVIEDSFNGIRAAAAAGTRPLMVPDMLEPTDEIRAMAHLVFHDLYEVKEYLQDIES
ncbi:MAG: HAD family phosphatase [Firmicutes bacterium]|nr:HAD family phosphatase [Bacillota bacterium]